ncbi:MAG: hypothetical protein GYB64_09575 [Chloroflexi bacterium]|nr:hypothetical protein [Chloroflexota bacterium]
MPLTFETLLDEKIVIITFIKPVQIDEDMVTMQRNMAELLASTDDHYYTVYDISGLDEDLPFGDLVQALGYLRGDRAAQIAERTTTLLVGPPRLVNPIAAASGQFQYEAAEVVSISNTIPQALEQIRLLKAATA